jgi:hypothetical protein
MPQQVPFQGRQPQQTTDPKHMRDTSVTASDRHQMIATAAYHLARQRAFTSNKELDDWLAAEAEIERVLGPA